MHNYRNSSPTVEGCTFSGNSVEYYGGGMYNDSYSSPIVKDCTFSGNSANVYGGGMWNSSSSPTVKNCIFNGNSSSAAGGMYNYNYSSPTVEGCTFSGNSAGFEGGGMYNEYNSSPTVTNCTFSDNSAYEGGGMSNWNSSPAVTNCTFSRNSAIYGSGGWMYNNKSSPTIEGCTFSANSASYRGGMYNFNCTPTVTNCILWADVPSEIYGSTPTVTYSDVQGGWTGIGNINADPCFVNPDSNDYHLQASSPCINAGDPNFIAEPNETDMDGEARVIFARVDMGADEFNPIHLGIVNKKRVARTEFVYDCNVTFTNLWPFAVTNVELQMLQASENMTIIEPNVIFGDTEFKKWESVTSIDTCTFRVDRSQPIDPKKIVWKVKCQRIDTGQPLELTINGAGSSGLEGAAEGKIDFEDLARLLGQWLRVGPAGSIPEDITGDGIINLADLAALAATPP